MLKKVAVNKDEIKRFIKVRNFKGAKEYITNIREMIHAMAMEKVKTYLKNELIIEKEINSFCKLNENTINKSILKDSKYCLMSEEDINSIEKNFIKLKAARTRKKYSFSK